MLQMSDNQYSFHTIKSFHVTKIWYCILMLKRQVMSQNSVIQYSCHKVMSCNVIPQISDIQYSYHSITSCYKFLLVSTHKTQSCHVTNVWYSVLISHSWNVMSQKFDIHYSFSHSCHVTNIWYSVLMTQIHVMSQMTDIEYSFHTAMSCHEYLIFNTHVTQTYNVKIFWYLYSWNTDMYCQKYLIFTIISHSHIMSQISDIQYS